MIIDKLRDVPDALGRAQNETHAHLPNRGLRGVRHDDEQGVNTVTSSAGQQRARYTKQGYRLLQHLDPGRPHSIDCQEFIQ